MNFKRLLYSPMGKIFVSIVLGLGLASMFRKACTERNCLQFKGPSTKDIEEKVYKFNDRCYSFKTSAETCSSNKKQVRFA